MSDIAATWSVSLDTECPHCKKYVDLLTYPDFWDGREGLDVPEHGTEQTQDMEVACPNCGGKFKVDCEW